MATLAAVVVTLMAAGAGSGVGVCDRVLASRPHLIQRNESTGAFIARLSRR